jgi:hypothetical protein
MKTARFTSGASLCTSGIARIPGINSPDGSDLPLTVTGFPVHVRQPVTLIPTQQDLHKAK